ncbi:MAG: FMN-binding negative transcriptional regulator [Pseudomonadota bacterium]
MHPNPAFRGLERGEILRFVEARGFGQISVNGPDGPLTAMVPFELIEDGAETRVGFHLVRSNPVARALGTPSPALLSVLGPDAYVSPNWYGAIPDQVPTWNYVAAALRGRARIEPIGDLRAHLERVSARFEAPVAEALGVAPWTLGKMSDEGYRRLERQILPASLSIEAVEGTWKLNQNKTPEARAGAAQAMASMGAAATGSIGVEAIPAMMRALDRDGEGA